MFRWCENTIWMMLYYANKELLLKNSMLTAFQCWHWKIQKPSLRIRFNAGLAMSKKHIFLGAEWFVAMKIGG